MTTVKGQVILKKDSTKFSYIQHLSINNIVWENKILNVNGVMDSIIQDFKNCGVSNFNIRKDDLRFVTSRIKLVEFLPLLDVIKKLNYNNIKCYVSNINIYNYINVVKENIKIPDYIRPHNLIMINQYLYQITPYGTIKHKLNVLPQYQGNLAINACIETSLINFINKYNRNNNKLFIYKGDVFQKLNDTFVKIDSGKKYNIENLLNNKNLKEIIQSIDNEYIKSKQESQQESFTNVTEQNEKIKYKKYDDKLTKKLIKNLITIFNNDSTTYLVYRNKVIPNDNVSKRINNIIKNNDLSIKAVITHYFYKDNFNYRLLFLCNDNLYFQLENNEITNIKDFKNDFKFGYSKNIPSNLTCKEHTIVLDQLQRANIISNEDSGAA